MVAYPAVLAVLGSLVVTGKAVASSNAHMVRQIAGGLDPSGIPAACTESCTALMGISDGTCADLACLCSATVSSSMSGCLQCTVDVGAQEAAADQVATALPQIQQVYDGYASSCNSAGQTVPAHTFTVGTGSGTAETSTTGDSTTSIPTTATLTGTTTASRSTTRVQPPASNNTGSSSSSGSPTGGNGGEGANGNGASRVHFGAAGFAGILGTAFALLV